jgi:hypothetical protein
MTNGCPLQNWGSNSRVDHAASESPTGPFKFVDVAIPTFASNPAPLVLPDGRYAIFHIGTGEGAPDGGKNCTPGTSHGNAASMNGLGNTNRSTFHARQIEASLSRAPQAGSTIHISSSLSGPWAPLLPNTLGGCNNPAPWAHKVSEWAPSAVVDLDSVRVSMVSALQVQ